MRFSQFLGAILIAAVFSTAAIAHAQKKLDLGVGSKIYWSSVFESTHTSYHETIIAKSDDYQIIVTENASIEDVDDEYFALFSGIYFRACGEDMPDRNIRDSISTLWPLKEGKTVTFRIDGSETVIEVGKPETFFLSGQQRDAFTVKIDHGDDESYSKEVITVLADNPATVRLRWDDTSIDTVTLITKPKQIKPFSEEDLRLLGNCAALIAK